MLSSRKHNQSGICWSLLLFVVYLSGVKGLISKHPVIDSDIISLFGSDPCIPGTLVVAPQAPPVKVGGSRHHAQEHVLTVSESGKKVRILEDMTTSADHSMTKEKTPMCLVNELARHNKIEHQYRLTDEEGPAHKKKFTVTLRLGNEEYTDIGPSIKKAQHSAASVALQHTSYRHPPPKNLKQQNRPGKGNITPTVELNALAMKRGEPTEYTNIEIPPNPPHNYNYNHRGMYTSAYNEPFGPFSNNRGKSNYRHPNARNQRNVGGVAPPNPKGYKVKVKVGDKEFIGEGSTAQAARHDAASKALDVVRELPMNPVAAIIQQQQAEINGVEADSSSELKSPISLVHEIALKRNLTVSFDVISEKGPPHMRTFVTKCTVGDQFEATAEGNGKKISKKRAAEKMLEKLRKLPPVTPTTVTTNPSRMKRKGAQNKKKPRNLIKETKPNPETTQLKEEKQDGVDSSEDMNPISRLIQIQQAKKEKEPIYILKEERGAPRRREFHIQVSVGDVSYVGSGPNKKIAKRNAAEGLLQVLGYSSSTLGRDGAPIQGQSPGDAQTPSTNPGGPKGRQIVPGLLLMTNDKTSSAPNSHSGVSLKTTAAVAKEYLNSQAAAASNNEVGTIRPSEQLDYLARILNFKVQYTDFRKSSHNEFLSLVSLATDPPQVCHGSGLNTDMSKDQAALTALRSLAEMGLDSITTSNKKTQETLTTNVTINATPLNATAAAHEMYMAMGNSLAKEDGFLNGK